MVAEHEAGGVQDKTNHVHQNICQHAAADLMVAPRLLQSSEKLLARHTTLVGRGCADTLGIGEEIRRQQWLDGGANMFAEPLSLEVVDLIVEVLTLLFQHKAVGETEELLIGEVGDILGVDLAEGSLDGAPRILEVDIIAM